MASAALVVPGSQVKQRAHPLPTAKLPVMADLSDGDSDNPHKVVQQWLDRFHDVLKSQNLKAGLAKVFLKEEAYWRDQLCLSWDFRRSTFCIISCVVFVLVKNTMRDKMDVDFHIFRHSQKR